MIPPNKWKPPASYRSNLSKLTSASLDLRSFKAYPPFSWPSNSLSFCGTPISPGFEHHFSPQNTAQPWPWRTCRPALRQRSGVRPLEGVAITGWAGFHLPDGLVAAGKKSTKMPWNPPEIHCLFQVQHIYLSIYPSIYIFTYLFYLSSYPSIYLFIYLSIYIYSIIIYTHHYLGILARNRFLESTVQEKIDWICI